MFKLLVIFEICVTSFLLNEKIMTRTKYKIFIPSTQSRSFEFVCWFILTVHIESLGFQLISEHIQSHFVLFVSKERKF